MSLDELDRLAAEKVMGWNIPCDRDGIYSGNRYCLAESVWRDQREVWQPTRRIDQAWECLEKVGVGVTVDSNADSWRCWFCGGFDAIGGTAAEAIVRACLKAKGVE